MRPQQQSPPFRWDITIQGKNRPGLEEDTAFKSLFLYNLHPCVRAQITLMTRQGNPTMQEIGKLTEIAWEIVVRPNKEKGENQPSHLKPTGSDDIAMKTLGSHASQGHPLHCNNGG